MTLPAVIALEGWRVLLIAAVTRALQGDSRLLDVLAEFLAAKVIETATEPKDDAE